VVVEPREDDVADAALAEHQEHAGELGGERRVKNERQGWEQQPQPLDLQRPGLAREQRVHDGDLDRAAADDRQRLTPVCGMHEGEPRRRGAAQPLDLYVRDRR